jgi:hypothetical protein
MLLDRADDFVGANPFGTPPASRTTPTGEHDGQWDNAGGHVGGPQSITPANGASTKTPFYRKRSFLISQVIVAIVGIGLLFVLLYPVVRAISQHIVNVSHLNIDRVAIVQPTNSS